MRGQSRYWGTPTTCTIIYRNGKWYASITVDVLDQVLKPEIMPTGAIGIDLGCKAALSITDGENHQKIDAPSFFHVGFGMLRDTIKYKIEQIGGVFIEVPTRQVKPSQTCPKCGHQQKKTLDIRVHYSYGCFVSRGGISGIK